MSRLWAQAPAYLSWTDASGTYRSLGFDLVEDEQWTGGADVTKHPVEVGLKTSDNIRPRNRKCTLKVVATNEPVRASQWSDASSESTGAVLLTNQTAITIAASFDGGGPAISITPGDGVIDVPEWDSKLALRILAGEAVGAVAGALGGVAGAIAETAGGDLIGELLAPRVVHKLVQTDAPSVPPTAPPGSISPRVLTFANAGDFVRQTIEALEGLIGQTIDVWGTKSFCIGPGASSASGGPSGIGGMAITDLTHDRNQGTGTGAAITIVLEQIRIVYTQTVPAPKPTQPDSSASVSKGNVGTFDFAGDANAPPEEASPFAKGYKAGVAAGEQ